MDYYREANIPLEGINLFGIRNSTNIENDVINDCLGYFTYNDFFLCKGTTDPGKLFVVSKKDRNKKGTFHLMEGYHERIWCIGKHRGYEALVNDWRYCKPSKGWRDANYSFTYDPKDVEVKGYFGINFHRMNKNWLVPFIGKYSSGCQVVHDNKDFEKIMRAVKETTQKTFSYMLFNIDEIPRELLEETKC